ncbi:phage protein [Streptococcus pneumoniae GA04175]|nr:phage protein [Streptococcus pneumoniae GA04175]
MKKLEKIAQSHVAWAIFVYLAFLYYHSISYQDFGQAREEDYGFARAIKGRL